MDRAAFYDVMRDKFGALSQSQVDGTEKLLDEAEKRSLPLNQTAYVLSTSWHETAATMLPIAEYGLGEGHDYGEPCPEYPSDEHPDGQVAYGRGYVQLTWQENYERADSECKLNHALLNDFDLALDPEVAAQIIFEGMGEGWFTGKKLTDYVNDDITDYYNARRVVNGTDRADMLAGYAEDFEAALRAADYGEVTEPEPEVPESGVTPEEGEHPPGPEDLYQLYEYKLYQVSKAGLEAHIEEMSGQGWRLIQVGSGQVIWERPKV